MSLRPVSLTKRWIPLLSAALAVVVASGAALARIQPAEAPQSADLAAAQLRVVTANLKFRDNAQVRSDWNTIGPEADIVFVQEAKNVVLRDILGDGWAVRQDISSDDRQGSAVVIRKSMVEFVGELHLVKGAEADPCRDPNQPGIMTRWITRVDVKLLNGRWIRATSLHMPPPRCQDYAGSPYEEMANNVVAFANNSGPLLVIGGDWNKIVDQDPNNIGGRTGMKPRGPDAGEGRIDGFYVSQAISTNNLHYLPRTGSDHLPVQMTISVPAP